MKPLVEMKCSRCKNLFDSTEEHIKTSQEFGVVFSPCCNAVSTVHRVITQLAPRIIRKR